MVTTTVNPELLPARAQNAITARVTLGFSALLVLEFWAVVGLLFDQPAFAMGWLLIIPGVMLLFLVCYVAYRKIWFAAYAPMIAGALIVVALFQVPSVQVIPWAYEAQKRLDVAQGYMGEVSPLQAELDALMSDRTTLVNDPARLSRLADLSRADTDPMAVLIYLMAAQSAGLDASDVSANGLVRPSDTARLEQALAHPNRLSPQE